MLLVLALLFALLAALGVAASRFFSSSPHALGAGAATAAVTGQASHRHTTHSKPRPAPAVTHVPAPSAHPTAATQSPTPVSTAVRPLPPVSATAFGPGGAAQGDNPQRASLAIDGSRATAWHTDWYTTALFGNLQPGTGLLLDMGRPETITAAQVTLGSIPGADVQLRAGDVPSLADLRPVASARGAGGVVRLRLAASAHGRYVLLWLTRLPPDTSGTFQASVHDVRLEGRP